jgi:hypothetical protein
MKKIFINIVILLIIILGTNIVKATNFEVKLEKTKEENISEEDRGLANSYDYSVDIFAYGNGEKLAGLNAKVYYDKQQLKFEKIDIPSQVEYTEDGESLAEVQMDNENNTDSFIWQKSNGHGIEVGNDGLLLCRLYFKVAEGAEKKENYDIKLDFNDGYSKATDDNLKLLLGKENKLANVNLKKKKIADESNEIPPIVGVLDSTANDNDEVDKNNEKDNEVIKSNKNDTFNNILPQGGKTEIIIISLIIIGIVLMFLCVRKIKKERNTDEKN